MSFDSVFQFVNGPLTFILNVVMPSRSSCVVRWALNYHYLYF